MVERGKRDYPYLKFVNNDSCNNFESDSFDAVILFGVLTCVVDNSSQADLIKGIKRVLKPGGILYINDFLLNTDLRNKVRYKVYETQFDNYGVFKNAEGGVLRHHSEAYIKQLLSDFEELEYEKLVFKTMNGNISNGFYFIGRKDTSF